MVPEHILFNVLTSLRRHLTFLLRFVQQSGAETVNTHTIGYTVSKGTITTSVLSIPPKNLFADEVRYLLTVVSTRDIIIFGLLYDQTVTNLTYRLANTEYTTSTNGQIFTVGTSLADGRVFLGGHDGEIYETQFGDNEMWQPPTCSLHKRTNTFSKTFLNIIPLVKSQNDPIRQIVPDHFRHVLYTLHQSGLICVYKYWSDVRDIELVCQLSPHTFKAMLNRSLQYSDEYLRPKPVGLTFPQSLQVVSSSDHPSRCLTGVSITGVRTYFSLQFGKNGIPNRLRLDGYFNPPFPDTHYTQSSTLQPISPETPLQLNSVRTATFTSGFSIFASEFNSTDDTIFISLPSLFFDHTPNQPNITDGYLTMQCARVQHIAPVPMSTQLRWRSSESSDFFCAHGWDQKKQKPPKTSTIQKRAIKPSLPQHLVLPSQHILLPTQFIIVTSHSLIILTLQRPIDTLRTILSTVPSTNNIKKVSEFSKIAKLEGQLQSTEFCSLCLSLMSSQLPICAISPTHSDPYFLPLDSKPSHRLLSPFPLSPRTSPTRSPLSSPLHSLRSLEVRPLSPQTPILTQSNSTTSISNTLNFPFYSPQKSQLDNKLKTPKYCTSPLTTPANLTPLTPRTDATDDVDLINPFIQQAAIQLFQVYDQEEAPPFSFLLPEGSFMKPNQSHSLSTLPDKRIISSPLVASLQTLYQSLASRQYSSQFTGLLLFVVRTLLPIWNLPLIKVKVVSKPKQTDPQPLPWYHWKTLLSRAWTSLPFKTPEPAAELDNTLETPQSVRSMTTSSTPQRQIDSTPQSSPQTMDDTIKTLGQTRRTVQTPMPISLQQIPFSSSSALPSIDPNDMNMPTLEYPFFCLRALIKQTQAHSQTSSPNRGKHVTCSAQLCLDSSVLLQFISFLSSFLKTLSTNSTLFVHQALSQHSQRTPQPQSPQFSQLSTPIKSPTIIQQITPTPMVRTPFVSDSEESHLPACVDAPTETALIMSFLSILMQSYQALLLTVLFESAGIPKKQKNQKSSFRFVFEAEDAQNIEVHSKYTLSLNTLVSSPFVQSLVESLILSILTSDSHSTQFTTNFKFDPNPVSAFHSFCPSFFSDDAFNLHSARALIAQVGRTLRVKVSTQHEKNLNQNLINQAMSFLLKSIDAVDMAEFVPLLCAIDVPSLVVELAIAKANSVDPDRQCMDWIVNKMMSEAQRDLFEARWSVYQHVIDVIEWECRYLPHVIADSDLSQTQPTAFDFVSHRNESSELRMSQSLTVSEMIIENLILSTSTCQKVLMEDEILLHFCLFGWMVKSDALRPVLFSLTLPSIDTFLTYFSPLQSYSSHSIDVDALWEYPLGTNNPLSAVQTLITLAHDPQLKLEHSLFADIVDSVLGLRIFYLGKALDLMNEFDLILPTIDTNFLTMKLDLARLQLGIRNELAGQSKPRAVLLTRSGVTRPFTVELALNSLDRELFDCPTLVTQFIKPFSLRSFVTDAQQFLERYSSADTSE
ncbi:putative nuclear pore complex protein Nup155 [Blattamonas nauphoetae]|uniref:Nuclear pore complex protein Nup155 n=1 Tax=Blattamonas nauphoetae TaxID=2049346 RepID=A0ABQ9XNE6_9EUKA|nr:putative nuclear pore complex protein Nup155 [Blattamonas nauphoetae]